MSIRQFDFLRVAASSNRRFKADAKTRRLTGTLDLSKQSVGVTLGAIQGFALFCNVLHVAIWVRRKVANSSGVLPTARIP